MIDQSVEITERDTRDKMCYHIRSRVMELTETFAYIELLLLMVLEILELLLEKSAECYNDSEELYIPSIQQ